MARFRDTLLRLLGSSSGETILKSAATASGTITLPAVTDTVAVLGTAQTWSAAQSYNSGDLKLNGATSGAITINAAAVAGSNTLTLPAGTTDFSATGGTSQVVKQTSAGGPFTVGKVDYSDLSGSPPVIHTSFVNPTGTISSSFVMMGLAQSKTFSRSGSFILSWSYVAQPVTNILDVVAVFGTGTAPVNGAALVGSGIGTIQSVEANSGSIIFQNTLVAVGALTPGTAYWFDLAIKNRDGATLVTIFQPGVDLVEF